MVARSFRVRIIHSLACALSCDDTSDEWRTTWCAFLMEVLMGGNCRSHVPEDGSQWASPSCTGQGSRMAVWPRTQGAAGSPCARESCWPGPVRCHILQDRQAAATDQETSEPHGQATAAAKVGSNQAKTDSLWPACVAFILNLTKGYQRHEPSSHQLWFLPLKVLPMLIRYQDIPRNLEDFKPTEPEFDGRVMTGKGP